MTYSYLVSAALRSVKESFLLVLATLPLVVTAALPIESILPQKDPAPSPELEPPAVVRIQVEVLRKNSALNKGIQLTYRFASPDNKRYTGPLNRFTEMVRSAPYHRLLNHLNAHYGPVAVSGDEAYQVVTIIDEAGAEAAYVWVLSLQSEDEFKDGWTTDAVIPADRPTTRRNFT